MKKERETTLKSAYICLEGESLNLNQLPPSQVVEILKAFVESLKKQSKDFRIESITVPEALCPFLGVDVLKV